jgi:hypothetical protein
MPRPHTAATLTEAADILRYQRRRFTLTRPAGPPRPTQYPELYPHVWQALADDLQIVLDSLADLRGYALQELNRLTPPPHATAATPTTSAAAGP